MVKLNRCNDYSYLSIIVFGLGKVCSRIRVSIVASDCRLTSFPQICNRISAFLSRAFVVGKRNCGSCISDSVVMTTCMLLAQRNARIAFDCSLGACGFYFLSYFLVGSMWQSRIRQRFCSHFWKNVRPENGLGFRPALLSVH